MTHLQTRECVAKGKRPLSRGGAAQYRLLVLLFPSFFPAALARQRFLNALLFAGFQIKGVALDLLDNVFLLHFALEAAQCILKGLALLQSNLCQRNNTPKLVQVDSIVIASFCIQVKRYVGRSVARAPSPANDNGHRQRGSPRITWGQPPSATLVGLISSWRPRLLLGLPTNRPEFLQTVVAACRSRPGFRRR
jgi:hypothetical protein